MQQRTTSYTRPGHTPEPPSTSGSFRNSLSQVGPDCSADSHGDSLEESSGWSPRQTDGGLTKRARKTTGSSSCSKRPSDCREPKNSLGKSQGNTKKDNPQRKGSKNRTLCDKKGRQKHKTAKKPKATQRTRYKRTIIEIVRKALNRQKENLKSQII